MGDVVTKKDVAPRPSDRKGITNSRGHIYRNKAHCSTSTMKAGKLFGESSDLKSQKRKGRGRKGEDGKEKEEKHDLLLLLLVDGGLCKEVVVEFG
ncbi:hypothetical protein OIU79_026107 [Salix purpurea]|uniref:Uncharacterized protein n=1 Tax=Salix purpurea TaxID=77065 RepID=A0A9Q0VQK4_SALPP|nr:hypothetical protein OIU79_026107 [Salix purpurea]